MANNKFQLPDSLRQAADKASDGLRLEQEKTRRAQVEGGFRQAAEQQKVMVEAVGLARDFLGVIQSMVELGATRAEWAGRVRQAELAVDKAQAELADTQARTAVQHHHLDQVGQALSRCMELFDLAKEAIEAQALPPAQRQAQLRELLPYAKQMVDALNGYKG